MPADTAAPPPDARAWLQSAAAPGRGRLRLAATYQTLETAFTVAQWAGLAWAAQDVLARRAVPAWPALALLAAGGLAAAAAAWGSARSAAAGRQQIAAAIREHLVAAALPAGQRPGSGPDAAAAALATVELADDVAGYHAQALPLRISAPASMAVIAAVTAAVQWPAAVVLAIASLIIPLNMRLAGLFAAEGADEQVTASRHLAAVALDSLRGMRTLRAIGAVERRRDDLAAAAAGLNAATMSVLRRAFLSGAVMEVVITFAIAVDATYIGLSLLGYVRLRGTPHLTLFSGLLALLLCPLYFAPLRATAAAYHSREKAAAAVPVISGLTAGTRAAPGTRRPRAGGTGHGRPRRRHVRVRRRRPRRPRRGEPDRPPWQLDRDHRAVGRGQDHPAVADRRDARAGRRDRAVAHALRPTASAPGRLRLDRPADRDPARLRQRQHPARPAGRQPGRHRACGGRRRAG